MVTEILRPETVQEALKARKLPGSAFLGGGTWLNSPRGKGTLVLISLEKLDLDSIESTRSRCVLGAMATFQKVIDNPDAPPAIRAALSLTASRTLRNMMTIGGEIALHPEDSALVPLLVALEAQVSVAGQKKPVPIPAYIANANGGLVLSISIAEPALPSALKAVSRTSHSPRSLVVAACARTVQPRLNGLRLVASDCRGTMTRLSSIENRFEGGPLPPASEIENALGDEFSPRPDIHASSLYKLSMTRALAADILLEMAGARGHP